MRFHRTNSPRNGSNRSGLCVSRSPRRKSKSPRTKPSIFESSRHRSPKKRESRPSTTRRQSPISSSRKLNRSPDQEQTKNNKRKLSGERSDHSHKRLKQSPGRKRRSISPKDIRARLTKISNEENTSKICEKVAAFFEESSKKNLETSIDVENLPSTQPYSWDSDAENMSDLLQNFVKERDEVESESSDEESCISETEYINNVDQVQKEMGFSALGSTNKIISSTSGGTKKSAQWEEQSKKNAAERSKNKPERDTKRDHRREREDRGGEERRRHGRGRERGEERRREGRRSVKEEEDKKAQERKEARYY